MVYYGNNDHKINGCIFFLYSEPEFDEYYSNFFFFIELTPIWPHYIHIVQGEDT